MDCDGLKIVRCGWFEFVKLAAETAVLGDLTKEVSISRLVLYRGHAAPSWPLSSTLERNLTMNGVLSGDDGGKHNIRKWNGVAWYREECSSILTRFIRNAYGCREIEACQDDLDRWMLGRHFGLASPYLDWSLSPFVAAYFALSEYIERMSGLRDSYVSRVDGVVSIWRLNIWDLNKWPDELEILVPATRSGSRARAQQCAFTKLEAKNEIDLKEFLESRGCISWLTRYDLDMNDAAVALKALKLMNISYLTLFPDVAGAAMDANVQYQFVWHADLFRRRAERERG